MSDRLLAVAAAQRGVVTSGDAARLDVDSNGLAALVRSGALVRVRRGAYVTGDAWADAPPERRLDLRTRAVLRSRGDGLEAATHQSALALHGLPVFRMETGVVDAVGSVARVRTAAGLRVHPADASLAVVEVDGCRAVAVDVALAQVLLREGRVDLLVAGCVVVEFDGLVKYAGAQGRHALAAEKVREDRLRALGYEVVRLTWPDLDRPGRVDSLVRSALQRRAGGSATAL
jgi:hypothetical protein